MSTALLDRPACLSPLMELSLASLKLKAKSLGIYSVAGNPRHKKNWVEAIESAEPTEPTEPEEVEIPFDGEDEADEVDGDALVHLVYLNIPSDRTIAVAELSKKTNLPESELANKLIQLELGKRVIEEPQGYYRRLAVNCPPPPPPAPIIRTCPVPERQDIPGIEIAENPQESPRPGESRRVTENYEKPCTTCDSSGLLDKNLTCINCNGKGWRTREEQLTINIRNICRTFVADLHDTAWAWQGNLQCTAWKEIMAEISAVRWGTAAGKNIWQLCQRVRELYQYCDSRKPNWGPLFPNVPAPLDRIDENHWLLLLIYPPDKKFTEDNHPYFAGDLAMSEVYCPPKVYDRWGVLGNTHMFIVPNEINIPTENILKASEADDYLVLRGQSHD